MGQQKKRGTSVTINKADKKAAGGRRPAKLTDIMQRVRSVKTKNLVFVEHAHQRLQSREILYAEVLQVFQSGHHEAKIDKFDEAEGVWKYAVKGKTADKRNLRVIVVFRDPLTLVITVIDLDK